MIISKETFGYISIAICLIQYCPLIYYTIIGQKKPHAFTRLIWAVMFGITYAAQYVAHGEAGSWSSGVSGLFCLAVAIAALRNGSAYITRSDWVVFAVALLAIPIWLLTHNPLSAALWATAIDLMGYIPTFRKSWHNPHEEMISSFSLGWIKQVLSLLAMGSYSLTTVVYPVAMLTIDFLLIAMLCWRRFYQKHPTLFF